MHIQTARLTMSPLTAQHWPLFYQLHTDPQVIAQCFDEPALSDIRTRFQSRLPPWTVTASHWLCLVIRETATDQLIGVTGFGLRDGVAEVGYLLLPQYHDLGYGSESLLALIAHAKAALGIRHFSAVVTAGNIGSEKVLAKAGFVLTQVVPSAYQIGGNWYADHHYRLSTTG